MPHHLKACPHQVQRVGKYGLHDAGSAARYDIEGEGGEGGRGEEGWAWRLGANCGCRWSRGKDLLLLLLLLVVQGDVRRSHGSIVAACGWRSIAAAHKGGGGGGRRGEEVVVLLLRLGLLRFWSHGISGSAASFSSSLWRHACAAANVERGRGGGV